MTPTTQALATQNGDALDIQTLGAILVKSGFFADVRDQAQAIVKVLYGRELGIGPIQSMQGIHIIKGKPTLAAHLVASLIQRSGRYGYRVAHMADDKVTIVFTANGEPIGDSTFTAQDAQAAGLTGSEMYRKFPRNMLWARALTNGARWYCPEVFGGAIYTPDELGHPVDAEGNVVDLVQRHEEIFGDDDADTPTRQAAKQHARRASAVEVAAGTDAAARPQQQPGATASKPEAAPAAPTSDDDDGEAEDDDDRPFDRDGFVRLVRASVKPSGPAKQAAKLRAAQAWRAVGGGKASFAALFGHDGSEITEDEAATVIELTEPDSELYADLKRFLTGEVAP